ncbi:hypothetical protein V3C99_007919 [Haemonchus contortus]|uniref:glucuronosyltransferase n=1 Tax=Haemonchus contortus TaxID=6289 RepID=A0A7I4YQ12_HAECO|nr:UDP-glucuronosyl UDP-glucosyltransferase domain containing protein [Haemonchus contortus]
MLTLILLCGFLAVNSYKILVFSPTISRSHMISNGRIADELAKAGHHVVLLEPDFLNISHTVQSSKVAHRMTVSGFSSILHDVIQGFSGTAFEKISVYSEHRGILEYSRAYNQLCDDFLSREDLIEKLRAEKFDAYFGEQINLCGHGLAYILGIKSHFWVSSCPISDYMAWLLGMPQPSSYIPSLIGMDITHRPSYWERAQNIWSTFLYVQFARRGTVEATEMFRKRYGENFPNLEAIAADSDMVFVNTDEFVDFPRPTLPHVVHIGGLGEGSSSKSLKLDKIFSEQMEKGSKGVVYFSLGTLVNTSSLPAFAMRAVVDAVKKTPDYHFILVTDSRDHFTRHLSRALPNVFLCSWAPQAALLSHSRLQAFITHGGYNSIMEASRFAVPLVTIPFYFDQVRNSRAAELNGWGIPVNRFSLRDNPDGLYKALHAILSHKRYKQAAVRISTLIRTKPFNASEKLIKYTEFVLMNGGVKELLAEGRLLPFLQYHNLDIFIPLGVAFIFACWIFFRLVCTIFFIAFPPIKQKLQ